MRCLERHKRQRRQSKSRESITPKAVEFLREYEPFRTELINLVDYRHPLIKLAGTIDWEGNAERFGALYAECKGRPGVAIRLMAGLHYLKHAFNLSDAAVVLRWAENSAAHLRLYRRRSTSAANSTSSTARRLIRHR